MNGPAARSEDVGGSGSASAAPNLRAARLAAWQRRVTVPLILAALLPILGADRDVASTTFGALMAFVCWAVFVVDLGVHVRLEDRYLSSTNGRVDLGIVVLTFPWNVVFPESDPSGILMLARLARVVRIGYVAARSVSQVRQLVARLGKALLYAAILSAGCALIVYLVEPASSGFSTYGDALWWSAVTITTVGYGDLVPQTALGRITAVVLMIAGLGLLGTLAGSLAAFFRLDEPPDAETGPDEGVPAEAGSVASVATAASPGDVQAELVRLRGELDALIARLEAGTPPT
ncbi:MAG: potassium channel family protein [Acidimicrobiales bacterium]|nr:potassium channel family protein [Acidimicrobiales bacterium]